jgi:uncharacterized protein YukE
MPNWTPNWRDVTFNHAAANQYAATCRQSAAILRRLVDERSVAAASATVDWEGPHRTTFDRGIKSWAQQADTIIARLRYIATQVEEAAARALFMQAEREDSRRRWYAEDAMERQAADQHARNIEQQRNAQEAARRAAEQKTDLPIGVCSGLDNLTNSTIYCPA